MLCMCMCSFVRANDMKIVCSKDAQSPSITMQDFAHY